MLSPSPPATLDDGSHAPAHLHNTSAVTADALSATLQAETILARLRPRFETYPPSEYVDMTPAPWDVYVELIKSIDQLRPDGIPALRCSYISGSILVEYMPTASHEHGHSGLLHIITGTVSTDMIAKGEDVIGVFCLFGGARYEIAQQEHSLEGDSTLALNPAANGPTLIIECGGTQSDYPRLHMKGMAWFDFSNVQVVILVNLQKNSKAVKVEIVQRLPPAAIPNAVATSGQLKANAITLQERETAKFRTDEAAAGVEVTQSFAFSSSNVHQVPDLLIPYSGLFGTNTPGWAPPGTHWTVRASAVGRWAKQLLTLM